MTRIITTSHYSNFCDYSSTHSEARNFDIFQTRKFCLVKSGIETLKQTNVICEAIKWGRTSRNKYQSRHDTKEINKRGNMCLLSRGALSYPTAIYARILFGFGVYKTRGLSHKILHEPVKF